MIALAHFRLVDRDGDGTRGIDLEPGIRGERGDPTAVGNSESDHQTGTGGAGDLQKRAAFHQAPPSFAAR